MNKINIDYIFLGTSNFSVFCLNELKVLGLLPNLIITSPDKPKGRGLVMEPNPVKAWAEENNVKFLTPTKLDQNFINYLQSTKYDLLLVASYGKIVPKVILDMPKYGVLNIHPSLLPKYRGPSPLQTQILNDENNVGVTIIKLDEQVDHGSLIAQEKIILENILNFNELEKITAKAGAKLLFRILPDWINGRIKEVEQNHEDATFTKKVEKNDGLLNLELDKPYDCYLKTLAYSDWPGTFFFIDKNGIKIRVIIKESEFIGDKFIITKVLPEGKKEMSYEDFLRGLN